MPSQICHLAVALMVPLLQAVGSFRAFNQMMHCRKGEGGIEQELTDKRYIFQDYIAGERLRGLAWLSAWTVLAIWITDILNKDSPLAP